MSSKRMVNEGCRGLLEEASLCCTKAIGVAFSRSISVSFKKSEMLSHYLSLKSARRLSINRLVTFGIQERGVKKDRL